MRTHRAQLHRWTAAVLLGIAVLAGPSAAQFSISGTVTDQALAPVANVDVQLYDDQGNSIGIPPTLTDATGFYSITGLPAGVYGLSFDPPSATGLAPKKVGGIVVNTNVTYNVTLEPGFTISGLVTDGLGVGIPDIDLNVYDQVTGVKLFTPGDNTDLTGAYSIIVPAGTYRIRWRDVAGNPWVPVELYNVPVFADTVINIVLESGFFVSGRVTNHLGQPVVDADLDFVDATTGLTQFTPGDNTDGNGDYQVIVPAGVYDIDVEPNVADRLVAGAIFGVPINRDTTINFTLNPGFSLSGFVRDGAAVGVAGADIDVFYSATGVKLNTPSDLTDATGHYEVIVPSGTFDVAFVPPVSSRLAPTMVTGVAVTGDQILNVTVPDGVVLSGLVKDNLNQPVPDVDIDAKELPGGVSVLLAGDRTDSTGAFAVVIVPGTYDIEIEPLLATRLVPQKLPALSLTADTTIAVTLQAGVLLNGTVRDSTLQAVPNTDIDVIVSATGDTVFTPGGATDPLGYYEAIIPTGTFDLVYKPDSLLGIPDTVTLQAVPVNNDTTIDVILAGSLPACCKGTTGNVNGDPADVTDIGDLTALIDYLFINFTPLSCPEEANINGDPDGTVDIGDLTALIDHLFINFTPAAPCP